MWPAIISAAGVLGSSLLGNASQSSANKQNMQIAKMNNEWSERMLNKQITANQVQLRMEQDFANQQAKAANDFTEKMWNQTNEYNSAKNQAARLREAGINPALAMGGANAGTASSSSGALGTTPSGNSIGLPSPSPVQVQPLNYSGYAQAIEGAVMNAALLEKNAAETDFIRTQSDVLAAKAKAEIAKMFQEERGLKYNTDYRELTESINVSNMNEDYLGKVQNREIQDMNKTLMNQQKILNAIQIANLPEQMKADISLKLAQAEYSGMSDFAKDLKYFEKKYQTKITREDLRMLFEAYKKKIIFAPYSNSAEKIGGVLGDKIKGWWKSW